MLCFVLVHVENFDPNGLRESRNRSHHAGTVEKFDPNAEIEVGMPA